MGTAAVTDTNTDTRAAGAPRALHCANCGAEFACGVAGDRPCWCTELPPLRTLAPESDCLCPACLRAALNRQ